MSTPPRRAVFLDRDGTIIRDAGYLASPSDVELLPGAAAAIQRLNQAAIPVVIVTNQSGIARGLLTTDDYLRVHARVVELLECAGAHIDASYYCPHHPDISGPCECRKPGLLLYRRAASALNLNLSESTFVGDRWRDVAAAATFGGRGVLVPGEATPAEDRLRAEQEAELAESLGEAVSRALGETIGGAFAKERKIG